MSMKSKYTSLFNLLVVIGILVLLNILGQEFYTKWDLTEDKRYTLSDATVDIIDDLDDHIYVEVLLDGQFPAGFKRLQEAVEEKLSEFRSINNYIHFNFFDPFEGSSEEIQERQKLYAEDGIVPVNIRMPDNDEIVNKLIYPYAIVNYGERQMAINLMESDISGMISEDLLNNSVSLLEYKLINTIQKLTIKTKPIIGFTSGNGELSDLQIKDFVVSMDPFYNIGRVDLDTIVQIPSKLDLLIVAKPVNRFSDTTKFKIDQYVMNGGKVMWFIDRLAINLDSVRRHPDFIPNEFDLNLDDLFFKYGFRLNPNVVMDMECTRVPLISGQLNGRPQYDLFNWYYHPLIASKSDHPIVKSLDRINTFFPGSIDTVKTKNRVEKTVLLSSSEYSRYQMTPVRINTDIAKVQPKAEQFNRGFQMIGLLLEGSFSSMYENRIDPEMREGLAGLGMPFKSNSPANKMLVIADGDIMKNLVNPVTGEYREMGYNQFERRTFANKAFIQNAVDYMLDDNGVLEARTKDVSLRLLNQVKAKNERLKWQLLNLGLPLLFLSLFGFLFNRYRKRRYAS